MATYTASLALATPHPNDDGLACTPAGVRYLWISEGSRPALILQAQPIDTARYGIMEFVWIPEKPATILADALLMITALGVMPDSLIFLRDDYVETKGIIAEKKTYRTLDLAENFSSEDLIELRKKAQAESYARGRKVICSVFLHSSILAQTSEFDNYFYDYEILIPYRTRLYNRWKKEIIRQGEFPQSWDEIFS